MRLPEVKEQTKELDKKVKDNIGDETMFKVKQSTKMGKIFKAYVQTKRMEEDYHSYLRFLLDGERIDLGAQEQS